MKRARAAALSLCVYGALSLAPRAAHAYRPFDGTDADVAAYREIELEVGPIGYLANADGRRLSAPALVFNYGIVPRWELVLEGTHAVALGDTHGASRSSLEDPELSAKTLLRKGSLQDGGSGLSLASELSAIFPSSTERGAGAGVAGIISERFSSLTLHCNLATELTRAHYLAPFAGLIVEGPSAWKVRPVSEVYARRELRSRVFERGTTLSALAGAIYAAGEDLSFDFAARAALEDGSERVVELRLGFTWAFEP